MLEGTAITDALRRLFTSEGHSHLLPDPPIPSSTPQQSYSPDDDEKDTSGPDNDSILSKVTLTKRRGTLCPITQISHKN